jgi:hypothetical protein
MPTTEAPPALHLLRDQPRLAHHRARLVQRLAAQQADGPVGALLRALAAGHNGADAPGAYRTLLAAQIAHDTICRRHRLTRAEAERLAELSGLWTLERHVDVAAVRAALAGSAWSDELVNDWAQADELIDAVAGRGRRLATRTRRVARDTGRRRTCLVPARRAAGRRSAGRPAGRRSCSPSPGPGDDDPGPSPRAHLTGVAS